ncbi:MAG TPA: bifunctional glutamate N-acetyltransferase/amino-acid acetyltransferase ArgJ [Geminicoccus sp.]|jgi:glutamate N-acetyltransferase/amino-acid N-acetyltransferase|uniref:bifunctional glutamate N-acetyltransferase/amino-acid acetyltransferase ArgJ n=1 Tax=Geminicoccus sp. TaxID=2024832 RepID=UPI002E3587E6|nr:bifunctional glutamate N-acetyltransferase/amino-acid acetyltransferase ArgJ [Geminicoccus sp.]HEX2525320.1 bifunctional glutamate N-acetyltransferase/amino-acid acetyltransferase ArgJ [Geminicoccus sp.]
MSHPISPLAPERLPDLPVVAGVRFATAETGMRYRDRPDLLLAAFDPDTSVAGVFTQNAVCGHPVTWCRQILPRGRARALVVNAGNANVFRGAEGDAAVRREAEAAAAAVGCEPQEVFVASTGVIGQRLDADRIASHLPRLAGQLQPDAMVAAAHAIVTTDTFPKAAVKRVTVDGQEVTLAGIAKGSGMIAPNMATMLAFLFTDARVEAAALQDMLQTAAGRSFNCVTVDSDTSTSDTLLCFATGKAGNGPITAGSGPFARVLEELCIDLAIQVAKDGEGAQKLITVSVSGGDDDRSARTIAMSIANSPLVKTAIAGEDANWGRVAMAVGKAGVPVDPAALTIAFGGIAVARDGGAVADLDEAPVTAHLKGRDVAIDVVVGRGSGKARVWTCDLTHGYIDINGSYRS